MLIGIKNAAKLIGISIIACCAVLVCTMFLNFYLDVRLIKGDITSELSMIFYEAQVSTAKVVCLVSGGCLFLTSVVMLIFYIKHYIDTHRKDLGILKALGYSNLQIAENFWVFGISVLMGTALGFGGAFLIMPRFYALQNKDKILPEIALHFHPVIFLYFVLLPVAGFSVLAIGYAWFQLKRSVLSLLKDDFRIQEKTKKAQSRQNGLRKKEGLNEQNRLRRQKEQNEQYRSQSQEEQDGQTTQKEPQRYSAEPSGENSFLQDLKRNTLRSRKTLVFFILFASFCFSAMTQMSFSMKDLASEMMGVMMMVIGLVLAFTTLFLAITTVINGNRKTIAMMRVFGYSQEECCRAILGGYRPVSYIGFAIGTGYQYALLRLMVDIVFRDVEGIPAYQFDFPVLLISLAVFVIVYEILMHVYSEKIKKISEIGRASGRERV